MRRQYEAVWVNCEKIVRLLKAISLSSRREGGGIPARGNSMEEGVVTLVRVAMIAASLRACEICERLAAELRAWLQEVIPYRTLGITAPMNMVMKAPEGILRAVLAAYFRENKRDLMFLAVATS